MVQSGEHGPVSLGNVPALCLMTLVHIHKYPKGPLEQKCTLIGGHSTDTDHRRWPHMSRNNLVLIGYGDMGGAMRGAISRCVLTALTRTDLKLERRFVAPHEQNKA